ncbi:MAG: LamG domain-containing protein, partial [Planctomycetota bacterium]
MKKSFVSSIVMCIFVILGSVSADITDGLIGYWPLDEGAGFTTADMSEAGYGFDGTLTGGPIWTGGQFGSALNFDGADDYVLCAERDGTGPGTYPEELMPETFTVSCWTRLDNFAYFSSFVGNGMDTGGDECGFFLYNFGWVDENEQDFGLAIRTETAMSYLETPNIYETNTWYHLAATYDGTNASIYIDGELAAGPESVGGPMRWISSESGNYPERFAIGVWLDPGYDLWIDGLIDDVGYWGRSLTADEVSIIFSMGGPLILPPNPALAGNPVPIDEANDVAHDV